MPYASPFPNPCSLIRKRYFDFSEYLTDYPQDATRHILPTLHPDLRPIAQATHPHRPTVRMALWNDGVLTPLNRPLPLPTLAFDWLTHLAHWQPRNSSTFTLPDPRTARQARLSLVHELTSGRRALQPPAWNPHAAQPSGLTRVSRMVSLDDQWVMYDHDVWPDVFVIYKAQEEPGLPQVHQALFCRTAAFTHSTLEREHSSMLAAVTFDYSTSLLPGTPATFTHQIQTLTAVLCRLHWEEIGEACHTALSVPQLLKLLECYGAQPFQPRPTAQTDEFDVVIDLLAHDEPTDNLDLSILWPFADARVHFWRTWWERDEGNEREQLWAIRRCCTWPFTGHEGRSTHHARSLTLPTAFVLPEE